MAQNKKIIELRGSREYAFAMLFSKEFNEEIGSELPEDEVQISRNAEKVMEIVNGVSTHQKEIDRIISKYLIKWKLDRVDKVDLTILRIAIYELSFSLKKLHYKIVLDEAIELAKKYGTDKSYKFVNGLLDTYLKKESLHE